MFTHSLIAKCCLLVLMAAAPVALAQTFTITGRSSSTGNFQLRLDETLEVTYSVSATGLTQPVVPVLVPSIAGQADAINTTWTGSGATTSLSNLTFKIHLYDVPELCGQTFQFDLVFYSNQFAGPREAGTVTPSLLTFTTSADGIITLDKQLTGLLAPPQYPLSSGIKSDPLRIFPHTQTEIQNSRLYLYMDWNLQGYFNETGGQTFDDAFVFWSYSLTEDCRFDIGFDLVPEIDERFVQGQVIDNTVTGAPEQVDLAPLGGGGDTEFQGEGINVFDITDMNMANSSCGATVQSSIDYSATQALFEAAYFYTGNLGIILRDFRIYLGAEGGCTPLVDNFGTPPDFDDFHIENFALSSDGDIAFDMVVPAMIQTGSDLDGDYRVEYFLRTPTSYQSISGATQSLSLSTKIAGGIANPEETFVEARITHVPTGAMISTTNSNNNHRLAYNVLEANISFSGEEDLPLGTDDNILDPGETVMIPVRITAPSGSVPTMSYETGIIVDSGNDIIDAGDRIIVSNGQRVTNGLNFYLGGISGGAGGSTFTDTVSSFELLTAPTTPKIWFFTEGTYTDPATGTPTTFRQYVSLRDIFNSIRDINAQDTLLFSPFDFEVSPHTIEGWAADNEPGNGGWDFPTDASFGPWTGDGGFSQSDANDIHALVSPVFLLGSGTRLDFVHQPRFSFNQSGGLLEYRVRDGGATTWGSWSNLISAFGPSGVYNAFTFPTNPPSYLGGQGVWMSNEDNPQSVTVNIPQSLSNQFDGEGEIQFRFAFQDPSLIDTARSDGPTHWEVSSFDYQTRKLLLDNLFRINLTSLDADACDPTLTFYADAPVHPSNLTFLWYDSLDALYDDTAVAADETAPFATPAQGVYTFYVRVIFGGTERIYRVQVTRTGAACGPGPCLSQDEIVQEILTESGEWPTGNNVVDFIDVVNQLCDTIL